MRIGALDIGRKLILAPMAEITDGAFRRIAKENGAGLTFTQMVSANGIANSDFETLRLFAFPRDEKPIGVQVLGNDRDDLRAAVREIKNYKPDVIDLNCGCPVAKVTGNNMGSYLLDDPKLLASLIDAMVKESQGAVPISVKMRLGKDKKNISILDNAKIAEDYGASFITVHTRTRKDKYSDQSQWEWLIKIKQSVNIPVVGNGSLFDTADVIRMITETGCDSVMVARGALGNPFLFHRVNTFLETGSDPGNPSVDTYASTAVKHLEFSVREFGEAIGVKKVKKHIIWYFKDFGGVFDFAGRVFSNKYQEGLKELIYDHAQRIESGYYPTADKENIRKLFNEKVQFWLFEEMKVQ